jgi:hypothetical protein
MPAGGAVRQAILHDDTDSDSDHAVGVMPVGDGQVQHVGVEVMVTAFAVMLGISHVQITGPAANRVAQVMQRALVSPQPRGATVTPGTTAMRKVTRPFDDYRLGKFFSVSDAFGGVGQINSRWHGGSLLA